MKAADIPTKITTAFAESAGLGFITNPIPIPSQISITAGRASFTTGFPPANFIPLDAGGVPPFGDDMNGVHFTETAWLRWISAGGGLQKWDSGFATLVGGYPEGAVVQSATIPGVVWRSAIDDNGNDPDAGGGGWMLVGGSKTAASAGANVTYGQATAGTQGGLQLLRSNAGAAMVDTLPGTGAGVLSAGTVVRATNSDVSGLLGIVAGSGAAIKNAAGFVVLGPGQSAAFLSDGANYWPLQQPGRAKLAAATTIYVNPSTGSASNLGLTVSTPFAKMQQAYDFAQQNLDLNGLLLTIKCAAGTYTDPLLATGPIVGQADVGQLPSTDLALACVIIEGDTTTPNNCFVDVGGERIFRSTYQAMITVQGFRIRGASGGLGLQAAQRGILAYKAINFDQCGEAHMEADTGSFLTCIGSYTVSGSAPYHCIAQNTSFIFYSLAAPIVVTNLLTTTFSTAWAAARTGGVVYASNTVLSFTAPGSVVGPRYSTELNGVINTDGGGANFFPGSVAGSSVTGGQYG